MNISERLYAALVALCCIALLTGAATGAWAEETAKPSPYDNMSFGQLLKQLRAKFETMPKGRKHTNDGMHDVTVVASKKGCTAHGFTLEWDVEEITNTDHLTAPTGHETETTQWAYSMPFDRLSDYVSVSEEKSWTSEAYALGLSVSGGRNAIKAKATVTTEGTGFIWDGEGGNRTETKYVDESISRKLILAVGSESEALDTADLLKHMIRIANGTVRDPTPAPAPSATASSATTLSTPAAPVSKPTPLALVKAVAEIADQVAKAPGGDGGTKLCEIEGISGTTLLAKMRSTSGSGSDELRIPLEKLDSVGLTTKTSGKPAYAVTIRTAGEDIEVQRAGGSQWTKASQTDLPFAAKTDAQAVVDLLEKAAQAAKAAQ